MDISSRQICDDILGLLARLKASMADVADAHGITPMQLAAMYSILQGEETMGQLAGAMHCDASNVTGIVDRLVAQDLIRREEHKTDRRAKTLQLTEKGHTLMVLLLNEMPTRLAYDKLSDAETEQLHAIIQKILSF
jgi:DNA-binding MarR family transcriptional regulator